MGAGYDFPRHRHPRRARSRCTTNGSWFRGDLTATRYEPDTMAGRAAVVKAERATALLGEFVASSELMAPAVEREIVHIPAARQPVLRDDESGFLRRCISPVLPGRSATMSTRPGLPTFLSSQAAPGSSPRSPAGSR